MIYRNSEGELTSDTDAYTIERYYQPFRSVKPYPEELSPILQGIYPYADHMTPARTVKPFNSVMVLPGGGNQPSLPIQAGSIVGFSGPKEKAERRAKWDARQQTQPHDGTACVTCGMGPTITEILIFAGVGYGAYYWWKHRSKKVKV